MSNLTNTLVEAIGLLIALYGALLSSILAWIKIYELIHWSRATLVLALPDLRVTGRDQEAQKLEVTVVNAAAIAQEFVYYELQERDRLLHWRKLTDSNHLESRKIPFAVAPRFSHRLNLSAFCVVMPMKLRGREGRCKVRVRLRTALDRVVRTNAVEINMADFPKEFDHYLVNMQYGVPSVMSWQDTLSMK